MATGHVCPEPGKSLESPQKLATFFPLTVCVPMCKAWVIVIL